MEMAKYWHFWFNPFLRHSWKYIYAKTKTPLANVLVPYYICTNQNLMSWNLLLVWVCEFECSCNKIAPIITRLAAHKYSPIKTSEKPGQPPNFHQRPGGYKSGQGVVYFVQCCDCNKRYIGETKRSLETRQKVHKADIKTNDATKVL